jgi:two-component system, chemotaxis family, sensor kinase CheA
MPPKPAPVAAPVAAQATETPSHPAGTATASAAGFVKVDTQKLDSLVDLIGELVISQSIVVQDPHVRDAQSQQLTRSLVQLRRITNELQRTVMSLRMVPIRATFQKMTRLVRDLAAHQQKQIHLTLSGEDTELDRNLIEAITDPLVHMVRNAADHGIERPDVRAAAGKPPLGTIHLRAFHQGASIVIQIEDDGNGLDKERLIAKAIERGLVNAGGTLSTEDAYNLIFAPGFSTAEIVSDISGRGVGMDVVRRNIEKLRGKIDIASTPGKGTTFTIYLPLTLAIIDGTIVSVGGERFIIPTLSVRESFRPRADMISTVHQRGEMINLRGRLSPLLRLYQYFDLKPRVSDPTQSIVVAVESGNQTRCLMVDELLGMQEVVIKSLGEAIQKHRAVSGGVILSDGRVALILDTDELVRLN